MLLPGAPELYRAVDARAGVPAAVGLVGIPGNDRDGILPRVEIGVAVHIEVGITVGAKAGLLPVDVDLRLPVHALEFQDIVLRGLLRREGEGLRIHIVAAFKPAHIQTALRLRRPLLPEHGVVRDVHGQRRLIRIQMLYLPVVIQGNCSHISTPS